MEVLNKSLRTAAIRRFVTCYALLILLVGLIFYFQFIAVPNEYRRGITLTHNKIEELVHYTDQADSLVMQIQKTGTLEPETLIPFYNWTNNLKEVYRQPFYQLIIFSYTDLVRDIGETNGKDTTVASLRKRLVTAREKNLDLRKRGEELVEKLREVKR